MKVLNAAAFMDVESEKPSRNGVHLMPVRNVKASLDSGTTSRAQGVEVQFDDGHRFRVDSDEPNRLAEALLREMRAVERAARG